MNSTACSGAWRRSRSAILAAVISTSYAHAGMAQATSSLREAQVRYAAALTSGDIETAATFFDDAGALTIAGCPEIKGRTQVRSFLTGLVRVGRVVGLTPEDVRQTDGDTGREVGAFRLTGSKVAVKPLEGRYATGWVKVGPDWRITVTALIPNSPSNADACASVDSR